MPILVDLFWCIILIFMWPSALGNMWYVLVKILSKNKNLREFQCILSSISMKQLTCRMVCVHCSWWLKDVKEKIITAIDHIWWSRKMDFGIPRDFCFYSEFWPEHTPYFPGYLDTYISVWYTKTNLPVWVFTMPKGFKICQPI